MSISTPLSSSRHFGRRSKDTSLVETSSSARVLITLLKKQNKCIMEKKTTRRRNASKNDNVNDDLGVKSTLERIILIDYDVREFGEWEEEEGEE